MSRRPNVIALAAVLCVVHLCTAGAAAQGAPPPGADRGEPINAMCPVLADEPIDPGLVAEWDGHLIGLCCERCVRKFEADPLAYVGDIPELAALAAAAKPVDAAGNGVGGAGDDEPLIRAERAVVRELAGSEEESTLPEWFGRLHVVVVHFPVALLISAAIAEILRRRRALTSDAAHFCLKLGTAAALAAAFTGWTHGDNFRVANEVIAHTLFWHRWFGVGTLALASIATFYSFRARRDGAPPDAVLRYRFAVLGTAVITAVTGHYGGTLVRGQGFLFG